MKRGVGKILKFRSMDVRIVDPLEWPAWDEALLGMENHSIFHTTHWARVLTEAYRYKPRYFVATEGGELKGIIPVMEVSSMLTGRRGVSLPFTDFCEPLAHSCRSLRELNAAVIQHGRTAGWRSMEWRGGEDLFPDDRISGRFYRHAIPLRGRESDLESGFRSSTRRNIRKAAKEGVEVEVSRSLDAVRAFYRLNCLTRKHHGLPPQPMRFFKKLHEHILSQGHGLVVLGFYKNRVISGCVYFHFGENAIYKYGGSDRRFQNLRANNLVMWEGLRWYHSRGFRCMSLGRSEPENWGLLQFKRGWNGREDLLHYHRFQFNQNQFVAPRIRGGGAAGKIMRIAPVSLLRLIGAAVYRHVG